MYTYTPMLHILHIGTGEYVNIYIYIYIRYNIPQHMCIFVYTERETDTENVIDMYIDGCIGGLGVQVPRLRCKGA